MMNINSDYLLKTLVESYKIYDKDSTVENAQEVEKNFQKYLEQNPYDVETWLQYALFQYYPPVADFDTSIAICKQVLEYQSDNMDALFICSEIQIYWYRKCDEKILNQLLTIQSDDKEIMATVCYLLAEHFLDSDINKYKFYLEESIKYSQKQVHNYVSLSRLYQSEGNNKKAIEFAEKALLNVEHVYSGEEIKEMRGLPKIEDFINEYIKGTHKPFNLVSWLKSDLKELKKDV